MENEPREKLVERLVDYASRLRISNKLQLPEAIGQALDYFGIQGEEERGELFTKIGSKLGERGRASAKKRKQRPAQEKPADQTLKHWRAEAERAGFENTEELLKHLDE